MSKKIGLLTFHDPEHRNYGAILQCHALCSVLRGMGHGVEVIHYLRRGDRLGLAGRLRGWARGQFAPPVFDRFLGDHIPVSPPYPTPADLRRARHDYDLVIVGSDQVWRPQYGGAEPLIYFLDFLDEGVRRVAYAASFGEDKWQGTDALADKARMALKRFAAVSVRERSGVAVCRDTFGIVATQALDPTLLAGRDCFDGIGLPAEVGPAGIVSYRLHADVDFDESLEHVREATNLPVRNLRPDPRTFLGKSYRRFIPVPDWLAGIRDAAFVVTDSFHAVCFSLLFERPFVCIPNRRRGVARLRDLLTELHLEDRLVQGKADLLSRRGWQDAPPYAEVRSILAEQRSRAMAFLRDAIGE
jgi:hypothetical protein